MLYDDNFTWKNNKSMKTNHPTKFHLQNLSTPYFCSFSNVPLFEYMMIIFLFNGKNYIYLSSVKCKTMKQIISTHHCVKLIHERTNWSHLEPVINYDLNVIKWGNMWFSTFEIKIFKCNFYTANWCMFYYNHVAKEKKQF